MDFLQPNLAPQLTGRDNNFSAELYFAPKSKRLGIDAASGWRRGGATDPGSLNIENETSTNATRLGTTRSKKNSHINQQDFNFTVQMPEITPFGIALRNKTTMGQEPVLVSLATNSGAFTVAVSGGGLDMITLESATGLDQYIGKALRIPIGSGIGLTTVYNARLENVQGNVIYLESALDEPPEDAAVIEVCEFVEFERGGGEMAEWSILSVITGDRRDRLVHWAQSGEVTQGGNTLPADNVGMTSLTLALNPETVVREGRKQDRFLRERQYFD